MLFSFSSEDITVEGLVSFLRKNSEENMTLDKPQRAPLLAVLEILHTLRGRGKGDVEDCGKFLYTQL